MFAPDDQPLAGLGERFANSVNRWVVGDPTATPPPLPSLGDARRSRRFLVTERSAAHRLALNRETGCIDCAGSAFDAHSFSRMKFGASPDIRKFAAEVVDLLELSALGDDVVITSAAHSFIPTAASLMARQVQMMLSDRLGRVVPMTKMHTNPIDENFAALTPAGREAYLAKSRYHIDRELIGGRHVLVIDDIRVTGRHELGIASCLGDRPHKVTYLYAADLEAGGRAEVENTLNNTAVPSLSALGTLLKTGTVTITEKSCKFIVGDIIGHHRYADLKCFLSEISAELVHEIYGALVSNGYAFNPRYAAEMKLIKETLAQVAQ